MNETNKNRKLNPIERFSFDLNKNGAFNCQIQGEFIGCLPTDILRKAVDLIQIKHFFLNVSINATDEYNPEFIYNPKLEIPIQYLKEDNWVYVAERELNTSFDFQKGPLCRVTCIEHSDKFHLILTLDHTISDGISGLLLFDDLIFICDQLTSGKQEFSLSPVPEVMLDKNSFPFNNNQELKYFAPSRPPLEEEFTAPMEERYTHFLPVQLPKENSQKFIDLCSFNEVSVHSGISAILLITFAREIRQKSKIEPIIDLVAPANLRQSVQPKLKDNQLGMVALQMKTQYNVSENWSVWDLAREVNEATKGILNNGEIFLAYKDLLKSDLSKSNKTIRNHERKIPYLTFSNLGKIEFGKNLNHFIPERINFSAQMKNGQGTQWGLFFTGLTASFNDRIVFNLHYLHPYWNKKRAEEFKINLLANFERI